MSTGSGPQPHPLDLEAHYRAASEASRRVSNTTTSDTVINGEEATKNTTVAQAMATGSLNDVKQVSRPS